MPIGEESHKMMNCYLSKAYRFDWRRGEIRTNQNQNYT